MRGPVTEQVIGGRFQLGYSVVTRFTERDQDFPAAVCCKGADGVAVRANDLEPRAAEGVSVLVSYLRMRSPVSGVSVSG